MFLSPLQKFHYYQQQKYSPTTLVPGNVRFMRIFAGFPEEGASNDSGIVYNGCFQFFRWLYLRNL